MIKIRHTLLEDNLQHGSHRAQPGAGSKLPGSYQRYGQDFEMESVVQSKVHCPRNRPHPRR